MGAQLDDGRHRRFAKLQADCLMALTLEGYADRVNEAQKIIKGLLDSAGIEE
jgi:hypothetical protein